ncbi:MAG: tetratricopeptide repeat protein [Promethearchaeota archaeon]|nr:MAG: tetratricopeptide repeat protein [Candidatus Lokiarchaeota archaeon]
MKVLNKTFKDLIKGEQLVFIVGAGCSVDPPSCLPAGREMMEAIINYTCAKSEIEKILNLKELRFEQLVEIIRNNLDTELSLINYYGLCNRPNLQHFFLAEMIKKGHFVITTNFDFLIEYALKQSGVPKDEIVPVITKRDFVSYDDPNKLLDEGKKLVYKIHGSKKNIITGENTNDSLIATIQALGSGKEGENVFQVEPFKRPLFENISNNRTLVVIGYSGSDDFDVVPTLRMLKDINSIIWIKHMLDDNSKEEIYEIDDLTSKESKELDKINQILIDIYKMRNAKHIYRLETNTTRLIEDLLEVKPKISSKYFSINLKKWIRENITPASELMKYGIVNKIYYDFNMYQDSMRCSEEIISLAIKMDNPNWKAIALNYIALIYFTQGNYYEALKRYEEALRIDEKLGNLSGKATVLNNIGEIYRVKGDYPEALKRYEEVLRIDEKLGNLSGKATVLNNIGEIYRVKGDYLKAIKRYKESLKIAEQIGDLSKKAGALINIGEIHRVKGDYLEAIKRYKESLKIAEQIGDLSMKAVTLNNIGEIHRIRGNYSKALRNYKEALRIDEQLGDLSGKAADLNNIGIIYKAEGNYSEALNCHEEALKMAKSLGDLSKIARAFNNIGEIHRIRGNYSKALNNYNKALRIDEQLGDISGKAADLNNIAAIYHMHKNYSEALKRFEEVLKIFKQLGDLANISKILNNIGAIYYARGNYPEALKQLEQALKITEQLGDLINKARFLENIGSIYNAQGNFPEAMRYLERALHILEKLGLSDSLKSKTLKKNIEYLRKKLKILFEHMENSIMSESSLKKDWLSSEEDEAWKDL